MKLLVVDDQSSVADGIAECIDWEECGFEKVFCAYSAVEAKQFLRMNRIDVMLCDIEMPYESGLQLLEWIQNEKLEVRCIMLTAHAEFTYAQQALKLGSVDYILQPASYEDIRRSVMNAVDRLRKDQVLRSLSDIGKDITVNRQSIAEALLFSAVSGERAEFGTLDSMQLFPEEGKRFWTAAFQVTCREESREHWNDAQMMFALDNVLDELLNPYGQKHLTVHWGEETYASIIWGEELMPRRLLARQIEFFLDVCRQNSSFQMAAYIFETEDRKKIPDAWKELSEMRGENVALRSGVFWEKTENSLKYRFVYKNRWIEQLREGYSRTTGMEAKTFLREMGERKILSRENLKRFYSDFLQVAYLAAGTENDLMERVLLTPGDFELYYSGFRSVESMELLIDRIVEAFSNTESESADNVLEAAQIYIQEHLKDEIRRDQVAEAVHMNADYLSKLFKKELGLSLKEYILNQKMRHAQTLLKTTQLPVGIIASMVGFDNFSHFSQTYKKITGERPMDTRE